MKNAMLLLGLICMVGCTVDKSYLRADRATYEAIAPEYRAYVRSDPSLQREEKVDRYMTLKAWMKRLEAAEGQYDGEVY